MSYLVASNTALVNLALAGIGQPPVADVDADTVLCGQIRAVLDPTVRRVESEFPWPELVTRLEAPDPVEAAAGTNGYWQFNLPSNCLRFLRAETEALGEVGWYREGAYLYVDEEAPTLVYVRWEADPALWDTPLSQAVVACLAADLAMPLTQSQSVTAAAVQAYQAVLRESRRVASTAGEGAPEAPTFHSWRRSRHGV